MATEEVGNLLARVSLDGTGFQAGISKINKQLGVVKSEFKLARASIQNFDNSSEGLREKVSLLNKQLSLQNERVSTLTKAYDASVEAKGADARATQNLKIKLNSANAEMAKTETELRQTNTQLQTATSRWNKLSNSLTNIHTKLGNISSKLISAGRSLSMGLTLPLVGIGTAAERSTLQFDDSMSKVSTIADTTQTSMAQLKKGVLAVSNRTGESASSLNEALYQTISAGVKTSDSVKFMGNAVKLAKGGFTDATTAVDVLSTAVNAYGLKASDASKISDELITTQNLGKTTVGLLGQSLGNVIPIAASVNVGTKQLFASLAELTKNGIKTDEAVTGLKSAYSSILKPSSQAQKEAKKLGLQFNAAHLKAVGWSKFLDEIKQKTHGNGTEMSKLFGNVRALNAVMVLAGKGSKDFNNILQQMDHTTGATDQAFQKMNTNSAAKLRIAFNKLKNAGIQLGAALTPMIEKVATVVAKLADQFSQLSPAQQKMIVKIGLIVAALGPFLLVIGKVISAVRIGITVIKGVGVALEFLAANPIVLIIAAITALGIAIYEIIKHWDKVKSYLSNFWNWLTGFFGKWKGLEKPISDVVNVIKKTVIDTFNNVKKGVTEIFDGIQKYFQGIFIIYKSIFLGAILIILDLVTGHFGKLKTDLQGIWNDIKSGISLVWSGIKEIFKGEIDTIIGIFKSAFDFFKSLPSEFESIGKDIIHGLIHGIESMASKAKKAIGNLANIITSHIRGALGIHSPSRVMMKIGEYTGQGLAVGMANQVKNIQKQASQLTSAAIPSASTGSLNPGSSQNITNHYSSDGMFNGAHFHVRNDADIESIAKEIYNMQQTRGRGLGFA